MEKEQPKTNINEHLNKILESALDKRKRKPVSRFRLTLEQRFELIKHYREAQSKYMYFIMAIDAAAIGYTVSAPLPDNITYTYLFLILAIIAWGISFISGCLYILVSMGADKLIIGKIAIRKTAEQLKMMDEEIMLMEKLAKRFAVTLLLSLVAGAVFYIIWHLSKIPFCDIF